MGEERGGAKGGKWSGNRGEKSLEVREDEVVLSILTLEVIN